MPGDVLVHPAGTKLDDLPAGTRIGTSAPGRIAQLTASHPHLTIVPVRGNADTRLGLTRSGDVDAVILALAGLRRLGRETEATETIDTDRMTPRVQLGVVRGIVGPQVPSRSSPSVSSGGTVSRWADP